MPINCGANKQYTTEALKAPPVDAKTKKFNQKVCGKFLFYARAIDSMLLTPISAIAPTEETLQLTKQVLDYLVTQEEAVLTDYASK